MTRICWPPHSAARFCLFSARVAAQDEAVVVLPQGAPDVVHEGAGHGGDDEDKHVRAGIVLLLRPSCVGYGTEGVGPTLLSLVTLYSSSINNNKIKK